MFYGQYYHQLDDKGRFRIPPKFREQLGEKPMLFLGIHGCLELYKAEDYQKMIENRFASVDILNRKIAKLKRHILSHSQEVEIDKQGRAPLLSGLREKCGIVKDIVSLGLGDHVEIWSKEKLDEEEASLDLDELLAPYDEN